jgi:exosortase family protein XrtM
VGVTREREAVSGTARTIDSRQAQLRFALAFGLASVGLIALFEHPFTGGSWPDEARWHYLRIYARAAGAVIALLDPVVTVKGFLIHGRYSMIIGVGCDAADTLALIIAAVLAFPASWRSRLIGIMLGVSAVTIANMVRICSLYFVGVAKPDLFEVAHHDIWPFVLLVVTGLVFLRWARWAERKSRATRDAAP